MKTTYKRNLLIGFGVSLLVLIVTATASFISIRSLLDSSWWVNHTHIVLQDLDNIISVMKDAETGQRGFLLTGKEEYLEPYHTATAKIEAMLTKLRNETTDNPAQQINCSELEALLKRRFEIFRASIEARRAGDTIDMEDLAQGKMYMDELRAHVEKMKQDEELLLAARTQKHEPVRIVYAYPDRRGLRAGAGHNHSILHSCKPRFCRTYPLAKRARA